MALASCRWWYITAVELLRRPARRGFNYYSYLRPRQLIQNAATIPRTAPPRRNAVEGRFPKMPSRWATRAALLDLNSNNTA